MKISILRLPHALGVSLPAYATEGSAGMDLVAAIENDVELLPGKRAVLPTGFSLEVPSGFEAQVRPRSGLAARHGITVLNTPGTIDSDYRGEVKIILVNLGEEPFVVTRGMRIAQLVIARHERAELVERSSLSQTSRGTGGHGSTGLHSLKQA